MPCPMRFVLVGFSVAVAALGFLLYAPRDDIDKEKEEDSKFGKRQNTRKTRLSSLLEYTNGVYVINQGKIFWQDGGCAWYTFLTVMISLGMLTILYVILPYFLSEEALSNFCPHHYIPYAHEMKAGYLAMREYLFL